MKGEGKEGKERGNGRPINERRRTEKKRSKAVEDR